MITDCMRLQTVSDARQWASDSGYLTDDQIERLATWIWNEKPSIGCTIDEHPLNDLSAEEFWRIADGLAE